MSPILVCTDGSSYAASIYEHAAWAATRLSAAVEVLHVIDHHRERAPAVDLSGSIGLDASTHLTEELAKLEEAQGRVAILKGKAILEDARYKFKASGLSEINTTLRHGVLVESMEELQSQCQIVVIGKRGEHADLAKGHLGGNIERVIRAAMVPVLVASRDFKAIKRFLIAYDGGTSADKAIEFARSNPLLKGASCHLLRAERGDDKTKGHLEDTAERLRAAGYEVTTELNPGSAETVIADRVKSESIDLLVMGAYGHSPIRQFVLGSTTTTMIRTCQVPVLMFR